MVHHITVKMGSNDNPSGDGFALASDGDELIVDANAFLISDSGGDGARLTGFLNVTINGEVGAFGSSFVGLAVLPSGLTPVADVTIGKTGDVFGGDSGLLFKEEAGSITNRGTISGGQDGITGSSSSVSQAFIINSGLIQGGTDGLNLGLGTHTIINSGTIRGGQSGSAIVSAGEAHLTNSGRLEGDVSFGGNTDDTFTDFKKVGHLIKNGAVSGIVDLGSGDDHFSGGANGEKVRDGDGSDFYKLGGGNDTYISGVAGGANDVDTVDGGKGVDTYDASQATAPVTVTLSPPFASGTDIGFDNITGFENVIGGSGSDFLFGNSAANTLIGGAGGDELKGFGGRDILTGGADADTFAFSKLGDSGTKASTRDVITDFSQSDGDAIDLIDLETSLSLTLFFVDRAQFTHTAGEIRESFSGGNTIVSADVNGDGKADFSILLKGHHLLDDFDFSL